MLLIAIKLLLNHIHIILYQRFKDQSSTTFKVEFSNVYFVYTHCTAMFLVWEKSLSSLVNWNDHITVIREIFDAKDASAVLNKHARTYSKVHIFWEATTIWHNLPHDFNFWRYYRWLNFRIFFTLAPISKKRCQITLMTTLYKWEDVQESDLAIFWSPSNVKTMRKLHQNFVTFSENLNFTSESTSWIHESRMGG